MTTALLLVSTALPFVVSPGASFTITVNSTLGGDRRAPVKVWAGTSLGIFCLTVLAAVTGVGVLIAHSPPTQRLIGVIGGCVLTAFGVIALGRGSRPRHQGPGTPVGSKLVLWSAIALLTNVKALTLYALVVPSITAPTNGPALYAAFAAVHITMLFLWLLGVGFLIDRVPGMHSDRAHRTLAIVGAAFMITLGLRTIQAALSN